MNIVFRVFLFARNIGQFHELGQPSSQYKNEVRDNHMVMFENNLKMPPQMAYNELDYINHYFLR